MYFLLTLHSQEEYIGENGVANLIHFIQQISDYWKFFFYYFILNLDFYISLGEIKL